MTDGEVNISSDQWSDWLLRDRHGGDPVYETAVQAEVDGFVDRLLDAAGLREAMTLVDIGTGTGVVAFRAIDRIGSTLRAILVDISHSMLRHAKAHATRRDVLSQCEFLQNSAQDLSGIVDSCVDVVACRAALAYVADKRTALREFHRILKPGGRISIAEPIFQDEALTTIAIRAQNDGQRGELENADLRLLHRWRAAQFPDSLESMSLNPLTNFSERDLVLIASDCGFVDIHMELHIDVRPCTGTTWEGFLGRSPHPWAPTAGSILASAFSPAEGQRMKQLLAPAIEAGRATSTTRVAYLSATKPAI